MGFRASVAMVGLACALAVPAWSAEDAGTPSQAEPDEAGLEGLLSEPVLSSASRTAESASEAPATTWSISGTDLRRFGIQSVEEAIRFLGHAMTSYEYDERQNAAFGARGFMSDNLGLHVAVLIDGNQAGGSAKTARGSEQYLMPIELVDHIEVIIGPGSVIYGNSAMLGVINVVTRSPSSIDAPHLVVQGSAGTPGDEWARNLSWGEVWSRAATWGAKTFQLGGDPFQLAWHFSVRWDRQQGRSVWRQINSDPFSDPLGSYTREDVFNRDFHTRLFAKATWGNWSFLSWIAYSYGTGTGPIDGTGASYLDEPEYGLDATWTKRISDRGDLSLRGYGVVFDSRATTFPATPDPNACLNAVGTPTCGNTVHYVNFRPFFEPILRWDWNRDGSQVSTFGSQLFVDGSYIDTGTKAIGASATQSDAPIWAPLPNAALYAQHIWRGSVGEMNLGLRGDVGILGWALSPRAALSKSFWRDGTLKWVFSTGFRTPTITERYLEIANFLTSNPDIQPEHVYSTEIDLSQRLGVQNLQISVFGTWWDGLITTRSAIVNGVSESQFANIYRILSAGVNVGWQGGRGPLDWGLSANYAPGRVRLPAAVDGYSDQQLAENGFVRSAIDQYGSHAFGAIFLPSDGMPDFYAIGHVSYSFGEGKPRISLAANLDSPRMYKGYEHLPILIDPRNVVGPWLPWSLDARGAVESALGDRCLLRFIVSGRTLATAVSLPRVGDITAPAPYGGVGAAPNPTAQLSAMLELDVRL